MGITLTDYLLFGAAKIGDIDDLSVQIFRRKVLQWGAIATAVDVVVRGVPPIVLPEAVANGIHYINAYGDLLQSGVPSGYTAVEYVERPAGNTEQYIETNWKPNLAKNIRVQGIATYMGTITDYRPILLGNYTGTRTSTLNIEFDGRTDKNLRIYTLKANAGTGGDLQVGPFATNDVVDFDIQITGSNGALAVSATADGTTVSDTGTIENVGEQTLYNMMLFKDHRATTTGASKVSSRIHYLKATEGDKVVFELIPAKRKSDNVVGFYDKVSGQFLTNQGTGTLVAGNEIVPTPSDPVDLVCNNGALKILGKSDWTIFTNPNPDPIPGQGVWIDTNGKWKAVSDNGAGCAIPLTIGKQYTLVIHKKTTELGTMLRYGQSPQATPTSAGIQLTDWYRGGIADGQMISFVAKLPYLVIQLSSAAVEAGMIQEAIEVLEAQGGDYTFLKYIEATGTQYIETGLSGAMRWVGAGQGTSDSAGSKCILSAKASRGSTPMGAVIFLASRYASPVTGRYWTLGGESGNVSTSSVATLSYAEYDVTFNDNMFSGTINQESFNNISNDYTIGEWQIGCATTNAGVIAYLFVGNIYRQQAYQNGVLVGDFIPAIRNSDNVVGMYDAVSGTFFENAGTGTFTAGPVIGDGEVLKLTPSNDTAGVANLLKMSNYVDTQEILTGVINHQLGIYVFDGTEDWTEGSTTSLSISKTSLGTSTTVLPSTSTDIVCTHYPALGTSAVEDAIWVGASNVNFRVRATYATISDWKTFLAGQHAAGTPVIIVYPLATAQDEVAPVPQTMQTVAGDNVLDIVQAGMSGLEVEVKYTTGVAVSITEVENAQLDDNITVTIA